jgi:hypothetical protein
MKLLWHNIILLFYPFHALDSLQKPYQAEKAAYPLDHIVVICREQEMLHSALPTFQRVISLEVIECTEFYMKPLPDI